MAVTKSNNEKFNIFYSKCEMDNSNPIPEITLKRLFGQYRDIYNLGVDLWNTGDYTDCKILNKFEMDLNNVISRDLGYRRYLLDELVKMVIIKFFEDRDSNETGELSHLTRKNDHLILQFTSSNITITSNGYVGISSLIMGKEYVLPLSCTDSIPEDFIKNATENLISVILHEKDGYCELRIVCNNCV